MLQKDSRGIGAAFFKGFHIAEAGELVQSGILVELLPGSIPNDAGGWNMLDIDLDALTRIEHLFVGLWDILGVRRLLRNHALSFEKTVKTGNRARVAPLPEFEPKDYQSGMWITAAHIGNELGLRLRMLIGMMVRAPGTITKRVYGTVITAFPAVDVLAVGFVFDSSLGNAIFLSVLNQR